VEHFRIIAKGTRLTVRLNGLETADIRNSRHSSGPIALQYGSGVKGAVGGPIKWRKVRIKPL